MPDKIYEHSERDGAASERVSPRQFVARDWLDRFQFTLPKRAHILDLGCGAGEPIARYFVDHGHQVTGIDNSEKMIALARMRFPRQIWVRADMQRALLDRRYDGILAWDSMFHLAPADQLLMIGKVGNWLDPGGSFLFDSAPAFDDAEGASSNMLTPDRLRAAFKEANLLEIAFTPDDRNTHGRDVWLVRKG